MRRLPISNLAVCLCLSLTGCLGTLQRNIIFPAQKEMFRDPSEMGWSFEEVRLPVEGEVTHGWFVPQENAVGVILFSHGNGGNLSHRLEQIGFMKELGYSVLAYDYGGYGDSTGKASERRCYGDIRAMWNYLVETRGVKLADIVLWGRSLGGGPITELAQAVTCRAVILESAFLSTRDVAREQALTGALRGLVWHRFANKDKVSAIESPLLVIHSPDDEVIPYAHGVKLFELATGPKYFLKTTGGHNTGPLASGPTYREGIDKFLRGSMPG